MTGLDTLRIVLRMLCLDPAPSVPPQPTQGFGNIFRIYDGRHRNGVHLSHFSVTRKAVQALEQIKLIEKHLEGGRKLTSQEQRYINLIADWIVRKHRAALKKEADFIRAGLVHQDFFHHHDLLGSTSGNRL